MGERRESGPHCSRCGARRDGDGCPSCGGSSTGVPVQLVALPGDDAPAAGDVRLVREIKGTAVKDAVAVAPAVLRRLAGGEGPPRGAATGGEDEPGHLLRGPGYRRRGRALRWLLWLLGLAAVALLWR